MRRLPIPLTVGILAVFGAACSRGSSSPEVVSLGSSTTSSPVPVAGSRGEAEVLKYSRCMRSHGIPNFPDPSSNGNLIIRGVSRPEMQQANRFCGYLLPGLAHSPSQIVLERAEPEALKYSRCMRTHGLPAFPDPTISRGAISFAPTGPDTARYNSANKACQSLMPRNVPIYTSSG